MGDTPPVIGSANLDELAAKAKAFWDGLTPEEKEAHLRVQRESWVRGEMALSAAERAEGRHTVAYKPAGPAESEVAAVGEPLYAAPPPPSAPVELETLVVEAREVLDRFKRGWEEARRAGFAEGVEAAASLRDSFVPRFSRQSHDAWERGNAQALDEYQAAIRALASADAARTEATPTTTPDYRAVAAIQTVDAARVASTAPADAPAPERTPESERAKIETVDRAFREAEAKWRSDKDKDSIRARIATEIARQEPHTSDSFSETGALARGAVGALTSLLEAIEPWLVHRFDWTPSDESGAHLTKESG